MSLGCPSSSSIVMTCRCALVLVLCSAFVTGSCKASYPTAPTPTVTRLDLYYASPTSSLAVGSAISHSAFTVRSDGAYENVTNQASWGTSDPAVLENVTGATFRAAGPGSADVSASFQGHQAVLRAFVRPGAPSYPYLELRFGYPRRPRDSDQAEAILHESAGVARIVTDVAWTTSDTRVATVEQGLVRAIDPGTTEIAATYNGHAAWYRFSVFPE